MSLSTAKAKYVSLSACCAQVIWMRTQLTDYGKTDYQLENKTKHIAVRYHFIKEHVEKGTIELYFVKTDYQLANLFTKALPVDRFIYLVCRLGMHNLSPQELERLAKSRQNRRDLLRNTPLDRVEVLAVIKNPMHYPCDNCQIIRVILFSIHSDDGNPSRVNIKQLCGRYKRWRFNLIPAESRFTTSCSIDKDKYMTKA
ncbi:hypothetical protein Tco_0940681 [Tanacetum coccineum]|uniref:Copia protein n=1 Tax=Tanacetum coccineum TaxID=301880 RepID=A0ABQ5DRA4_9ASTR